MSLRQISTELRRALDDRARGVVGQTQTLRRTVTRTAAKRAEALDEALLAGRADAAPATGITDSEGRLVFMLGVSVLGGPDVLGAG
jgi:hypothetical protein